MSRSSRPTSKPSRWTPTATFRPSVPDIAPMTTALERAAPLVSLMQRLQASQRCLDAVRAVLPGAMAAHVRPGPIDDEGWTLLAANAAVSAKLRQLEPRLMEALLRKGLKVNAIRVRVQTQ